MLGMAFSPVDIQSSDEARLHESVSKKGAVARRLGPLIRVQWSHRHARSRRLGGGYHLSSCELTMPTRQWFWSGEQRRELHGPLPCHSSNNCSRLRDQQSFE